MSRIFCFVFLTLSSLERVDAGECEQTVGLLFDGDTVISTVSAGRGIFHLTLRGSLVFFENLQNGRISEPLVLPEAGNPNAMYEGGLKFWDTNHILLAKVFDKSSVDGRGLGLQFYDTRSQVPQRIPIQFESTENRSERIKPNLGRSHTNSVYVSDNLIAVLLQVSGKSVPRGVYQDLEIAFITPDGLRYWTWAPRSSFGSTQWIEFRYFEGDLIARISIGVKKGPNEEEVLIKSAEFLNVTKRKVLEVTWGQDHPEAGFSSWDRETGKTGDGF